MINFIEISIITKINYSPRNKKDSLFLYVKKLFTSNVHFISIQIITDGLIVVAKRVPYCVQSTPRMMDNKKYCWENS